jgi:RimJ/RimL family protein N-acetyltransferase
MPVLETPRLILRPFREEDVDLLAELMANTDFMRFSLGVFTREQTRAFLDKIIGWERRGLPSQFAVIHRSDNRLIGYCGFSINRGMEQKKSKLDIGLILIIGAGDSRPKERKPCGIMRFEI